VVREERRRDVVMVEVVSSKKEEEICPELELKIKEKNARFR